MAATEASAETRHHGACLHTRTKGQADQTRPARARIRHTLALSHIVVGFSLCLASCGQSADLQTREIAQRAEAERLATLQKRLDKIRADFDAVSGAGANQVADPAASLNRRVGNIRPRQPLRDAFRIHVERTGVARPLPVLKEPIRAKGPCAWRFDLPAFRHVSDLVLRNSGIGRASPLLLLEDGEPLVPHASTDAVTARCTGSFRHAGNEIQFSPEGRSEAATLRRYRLAYDEKMPLPRAEDGRSYYWVFPGTQLEFQLRDTWSREWGEPKLTIGLKVTGPHLGTPMLDLPTGPHLLKKPIVVHEEVLDSSKLDGSWSFRVSSPVDGPFIAVHTLTIGNPENARVFLADHTP